MCRACTLKHGPLPLKMVYNYVVYVKDRFMLMRRYSVRVFTFHGCVMLRLVGGFDWEGVFLIVLLECTRRSCSTNPPPVVELLVSVEM